MPFVFRRFRVVIGSKKSRNFLGAAFLGTLYHMDNDYVLFSTVFPGYLVILSVNTRTDLTARRIWRINVNAALRDS